ncbi:hypothetical protein VNO77_00194 [Canavalia gladiata]|uniref:Protein SAR DEFICIENT 1 n=1 Tax=Canavalia gladiata TaxID=3824 RepID=A0AAN9MVD0_CANGL
MVEAAAVKSFSITTKRFLDDSDKDIDKPRDKRMTTTTTTTTTATRPSFASVIGEVVMVKNLQNLFSGMEPLLRKVVNEEMERVMRHCYPRSITRSPSLRIESLEQASKYEMTFNKKLSLPIFTGNKISDIDGNPIQVVLVDKSGGQMVPTSLPYPIKLEIVVLDGEFPSSASANKESWTSEEFNNHIVKERTGRRPLLTGELIVTMRDGIAPFGDIEFTDNSCWIRCRKFIIAVRVAPTGTNQTLRIREAITEPFVVKDHRGELYKKHHPPMLNDHVWRLEKIGKDGAFHKKLSSEGINTVQDFLKLSVVDPRRLRQILGIGMSERMWEITMKHAKTCNMGNKFYAYRGPNFTIFLNAICQLVRAEINGQNFPARELGNINRSYMEKLVREAHERWKDLEEIDGVLNDNVALLTQGETVEQFPNNHQASVIAYDQNDYFGDKCAEAGSYVSGHNAQIGCGEWPVNATFATTSYGIPYSFSESQSDGDISPSIDGAPRWH